MRNIILVSVFTCFLFSCEKKAPKNHSLRWCGEAYEDLEKMMTALKDTLPRGQKDFIIIPKKSFYLQQCHLLPLKAQMCLAVSFAQKNIKDCQKLDLKGDDKKNFESLITGK